MDHCVITIYVCVHRNKTWCPAPAGVRIIIYHNTIDPTAMPPSRPSRQRSGRKRGRLLTGGVWHRRTDGVYIRIPNLYAAKRPLNLSLMTRLVTACSRRPRDIGCRSAHLTSKVYKIYHILSYNYCIIYPKTPTAGLNHTTSVEIRSLLSLRTSFIPTVVQTPKRTVYVHVLSSSLR